MILNDKESLQKRMDVIETTFIKNDDLTNRLFFMAKNGAISRILREFEHFFMDKDMKVKAEWNENSTSTYILLTLFSKNNEHTRTIQINREVMHPEPEGISPCIYSLKSILNGAYYSARKPKVAVELDELLGGGEFFVLAEKSIIGVNYPFCYESQSSS